MINFLSAITALAVSVTAVTTAERNPQTDSAAVKRFDQSLNNYLALKERLHREVPELRVTGKSEEINNRSDMLAGAIQRARATARQGEFFEPDIARIIRTRVSEALRGENVASLLARINDEPILKGPPTVHLRFPTTSAMATMPAHLLEALPALPKGLEYRFAGRTLILRDRDAALIIDILPDALPK